MLFYLFAGMNAEAIQRVAQNMPSHMLHSLSQVASHTPHYPHTPAAYSMHQYPATVSWLKFFFQNT